MKKTFVLGLTVLLGAITLSGCEKTDKEFARELQCLDRGLDKHCNDTRSQRDVHIKYDFDDDYRHYGPMQPGSYTNYYGDPRYGYWDTDGVFRFNDPYSSYATSTNSYLLAAGLGSLATYAVTKSMWSKKHPSGYKEVSITSDKYYDKKGKPISKTEYLRRKEQSLKDREKYLNKKKKQAQNTKSRTKPAAQKKMSQADMNKKKAELKKNQALRAEQRKAKEKAQQKLKMIN